MKENDFSFLALMYGFAMLQVAINYNSFSLLKVSLFGATNLTLFCFFMAAGLVAIKDVNQRKIVATDVVVCVLYMLAGANVGHKQKCFLFTACWAGLMLAMEIRNRKRPIRALGHGVIIVLAISGLIIAIIVRRGEWVYLVTATVFLSVSISLLLFSREVYAHEK